MYMPTPIDKPFIRHLNEDTLDNRPENLTFTASTEKSDAILFTKSAQWRMLFASRIIDPEQRQHALDATTSDECSLAECKCKCLYVARDLPSGGPEFMHRDVAL